MPPHDFVWIELYSATGHQAQKWLDVISSHTPLYCLEDMLVNLPLTNRTEVKNKPWGLFSDIVTLGDYTLMWDVKQQLVWLYEQTDLDDPWSNV